MPRPTIEECIVYAGHAGVSFDAEFPIYGFLPVATQHPPYALLDLLQAGGVLQGEVSDHTAYFSTAQSYGCTLISVEYRYVVSEQQTFLRLVQSQMTNCTLKYSFPGQGGDCNCAAWLGKIGLQLPESTGQMKLFVRELELLKVNSPIVVG